MRVRGAVAAAMVGVFVGVVVGMLGVIGGCASKAASEAARENRRFEYTQLAMGVRARVVLFASDEECARKAARAAFATIAEIEEEISDYRTDNALAKIHAGAGTGVWLPVGPHTAANLELGLEVCERTNGALDPSLGGVVALWRRAVKTGTLPGDEYLRNARGTSGVRNVEFDPAARAVRLKHASTRLDFGGIGKGYGAEMAARVLREHGVASFLVGLGGDLCVGAAPAGATGWAIAIDGADGMRAGVLTLTECAVSTSGDTHQFIEVDGVRYSHILDPRTGLGLTQTVVATIVVARAENWPPGLADALATAVCAGGRGALTAYPTVGFRLESRKGVETSGGFPVMKR